MDKSDKTKSLLINTVISLLREGTDISKVTSRMITEKAAVNLSTINYHFDSKDELINIAVNKLISDEAEKSFERMENSSDEPKLKLRNFLVMMSNLVISYKKFLQPVMPYILLNKEFSEAEKILPFVRECVGDKKSETECRILSYEIISFMQLVFYREDEFKKFTGVNFSREGQVEKLIDMKLSMIFKD